MSLRQAAQQALDALTLLQGDIEWTSNSPTLKFVNSTVAALRAALAEPEEYAAQNPLGGPAKVFDAMADAIRSGDDYHATLRRYGFAEVKAPQPEQEPVAWLYRDSWGTMKLSQIMPPPVGAFPVYTAPTPRKESTDES